MHTVAVVLVQWERLEAQQTLEEMAHQVVDMELIRELIQTWIFYFQHHTIFLFNKYSMHLLCWKSKCLRESFLEGGLFLAVSGDTPTAALVSLILFKSPFFSPNSSYVRLAWRRNSSSSSAALSRRSNFHLHLLQMYSEWPLFMATGTSSTSEILRDVSPLLLLWRIT